MVLSFFGCAFLSFLCIIIVTLFITGHLLIFLVNFVLRFAFLARDFVFRFAFARFYFYLFLT